MLQSINPLTEFVMMLYLSYELVGASFCLLCSLLISFSISVSLPPLLDLRGPPKVFWLAAFTFPNGLLTALQQAAARKQATPIDTLGWEFLIEKGDEASIAASPKEGAYVKGLFLEGARWNVDEQCLSEAEPMRLYAPMPIMLFRPAKAAKRPSKGVYPCPLYMYPIRTTHM